MFTWRGQSRSTGKFTARVVNVSDARSLAAHPEESNARPLVKVLLPSHPLEAHCRSFIVYRWVNDVVPISVDQLVWILQSLLIEKTNTHNNYSGKFSHEKRARVDSFIYEGYESRLPNETPKT